MRQLSPLDWARYGTNRIAYLRPVMVNNQRAIAIHAADGTQIGAAPDYALAAAAISANLRPSGWTEGQDQLASPLPRLSTSFAQD